MQLSIRQDGYIHNLCLDKDKDCKRQDQPSPGHAPRLGQTQAHQQLSIVNRVADPSFFRSGSNFF